MKIKEYRNQAKFFLERKITALYLNSKRDEKLDLLENCLTLAFSNDVLPSRLAYFVRECDDYMAVKVRIQQEKIMQA